MNTEIIHYFIAFLIASIVAIFDLLQTFSGHSLRRTIGWTSLYCIFAGLTSLLVFLILSNITISIGDFEATDLVKSIISGLSFKPIIQSKIFMLKTKELEEPNYGPAATYEKLSNVIKKQISLVSVSTNVDIINVYLNLRLSELRQKTITVIYANEMWTEAEKANQVQTLLSNIDALPSNDLKKLALAHYLQRHTSSSYDLDQKFSEKLNSLPQAEVKKIGERVLKTISNPNTKRYFTAQLNETGVTIQTLRRLILRYADSRVMKDVVLDRIN